MRRVITCALVAALTSGCAYVTLNSPRPLEPEQAQVGIHAGTLGIIASESSETATGFGGLLLAVTTRAGVLDGLEVGANVSNLGVDGMAKYGFLEHESPLQVSAMAGMGLLYFSLIDVTAGLLVGYEIAKTVMPYIGYRQHVIIADGPAFLFNVIGGLELSFTDTFGMMVEANVGESLDVNVDLDGDDGSEASASFTAITITGGLTFTF